MSEREDVMGRVRRPRVVPPVDDGEDLDETGNAEGEPAEDDDGYEFYKENEEVFRRGF